jgi:hypothetical protein
MQQFDNNNLDPRQAQQFAPNQTSPNLQSNQSYQQPNPQFQNSTNSSYPKQYQPITNPVLVNKPQLKQAKASIFNLKNILIALLSLYSIFSFSWIAILYLGVEGNKICIADNLVCKISVPVTKQAAAAVANNNETKNQLVKQKSAKNFVKEIWQNQAIANDTLITRQQSVEKSIGAFTAYIQNYIRYINDRPEFLKGFSKTELDNKKTDIDQQLANLKSIQDNNYQNKINNQKQINQLYQDLGERQDNSFEAQR